MLSVIVAARFQPSPAHSRNVGLRMATRAWASVWTQRQGCSNVVIVATRLEIGHFSVYLCAQLLPCCLRWWEQPSVSDHDTYGMFELL